MFRFEIGNVGSITFLSERSVLCFLFSEDDNLCLSDWSELLFLSFQLVKDEKSRPSCLACWFWYRRIALSDLYGSKFWAELWKKLLQCFFIEFGLIEALNFLFHIEILTQLSFQIELSDWRNGLSITSLLFRCQAFADLLLWETCSKAAQKIEVNLTMFDCYTSPSRWWDYVCFA